MHFLGVFDEEPECEDKEDAESEEIACSDALRMAAVDDPSDDEERQVCQCLIQLSRVSRKLIHLFEDERPRHVGGFAYDLAVHQVAHADGGCT